MTWAVPQLSRLLSLDEESLKQIITYADTLPKDAAAEHFQNLLGATPQSLEFISSFNARRGTPPAANPPSRSAAAAIQHQQDNGDSRTSEGVPRPSARPKKKNTPFNQLPPPRQVGNHGDTASGYKKRQEDDYISGRAKSRKEPLLANTLALQDRPDALQLPKPSSVSSSRTASPQPSKLPPSASGPLISDPPMASRSSSPASKPAQRTKISVAGGKSMHGASQTISDLDGAIRQLEIQTNPGLSSQSNNAASRRCNCQAQRHPLLAVAPNCLSCGKIICVKEGMGPCTFCMQPLLKAEEIQGMIAHLKQERGQEKMMVNNAQFRKAEVAKAPRPFSAGSSLSSPGVSDSEAESKAKAHRDKLLGYQAQNVKRTTIRDEAADFETPSAGLSQWASPAERAMQLKRQQKVMREQEWAAKPEYEKRRIVVSVDLKGGKVVKRMADVDHPNEPVSEEEEDATPGVAESLVDGKNTLGGVFSRNPLLGGLIRPVARESKSKGRTEEGEVGQRKRDTWRRVQDDNDDNEQWILDGGVYGGRTEGRVLGAEEHAQG